ncbi:MAG: hypothetical protein LBT54_05700, partial [Bifidobacteriaceae bacterium]|nr:hypothetical protein [Bifidobacteriaceae bacterium]
EAEGEAWIGQQVAAVNEQRGQSGLAPLESVEHHTPLVVDFGRWYILSEQATAGEIDSTVFNTIFESLSMDPTIAQFNPRFGILDLQTSQAVSPLAYPWTIGTGLGDATEEQ